MKKNVLIILIIFTTLDLFSQVGKGKISIAASGNYIKTSSEIGVTTNQFYTKGNYLNTGASLGFFATDRWIVGAGLDYIYNKETRYNRLLINNFYQYEKMELKSKVFLPNVYLGNYFQVVNKLYVITTFKLSYGTARTTGIANYTGGGYIADTVYNWDNYENGDNFDYKNSFLNAELFPEVIYFISPKFGVCLNLGGVSYSMTDWKRNESSFAINFKPDYWRFGIKINM